MRSFSTVLYSLLLFWCSKISDISVYGSLSQPDWVEASGSAPRAFTFAAMDCTIHGDTCNIIGTAGYPTLRYFEPLVEGAEAETAKGVAGENYAGMARSVDDLLWFARDRIEKAAKAEAKNVNKDTDLFKMKMKALKLLLKVNTAVKAIRNTHNLSALYIHAGD